MNDDWWRESLFSPSTLYHTPFASDSIHVNPAATELIQIFSQLIIKLIESNETTNVAPHTFVSSPIVTHFLTSFHFVKWTRQLKNS